MPKFDRGGSKLAEGAVEIRQGGCRTHGYFCGQVKAEVNKAARGSQLRGWGGFWGGEVNNAAGEVNNATDAEVN